LALSNQFQGATVDSDGLKTRDALQCVDTEKPVDRTGFSLRECLHLW